MRDRAWAKVKAEQPLLLIDSPVYTAFGAWQHINNVKRGVEIVAKEYARGMRHISFCCELYAYHSAHGRYVLHEHPAQVVSSGADVVKKILDLEGVCFAVGYQCRYGAEPGGQPIKKPTGFMSTCAGIRKALSKTCSAKHGRCSRPTGGSHVLCDGRVARIAAIFPIRLRKAILEGLGNQLNKDGVVLDGAVVKIQTQGEQ